MERLGFCAVAEMKSMTMGVVGRKKGFNRFKEPETMLESVSVRNLYLRNSKQMGKRELTWKKYSQGGKKKKSHSLKYHKEKKLSRFWERPHSYNKSPRDNRKGEGTVCNNHSRRGEGKVLKKKKFPLRCGSSQRDF